METKKTSKRKAKRISIHKLTKILIIEGLVLTILIIGLTMINLTKSKDIDKQVVKNITPTPTMNITPTLSPEEEKEKQEKIEKEKQTEYLKAAEALAIQYDYDGAISYLKGYGENYSGITEFVSAITDYEAKKAKCEPFGAYSSAAEVNHIFFTL